jgi:DNA-binding transcriptional MocR family regulator
MKNKTDFAYHSVYRYLIRLINEIQTGSATKLPSLRLLAKRLQVSISTVQNAYSLLEKEGRVRAVPKSGYFAQPGSLDASLSNVPTREENLLQALYNSARRPGMAVLGNDEPVRVQSSESPLLVLERELIRQYPRALDPSFQPFGDIELRCALAARYTTCAERCWYPENVFIGPDLRAMLTVVLETLHLRGATVLVESPCTWTLLRLLRSFDIRVIEMPLDGAGCINLQALDQTLLMEKIGLAILPSLINPARGSVSPLHNRQGLAELLNRYRVWVLENDSHGELGFEPAGTRLRELIDPQRLIIMGAFDKILGAEAPYGYLLGKHFDVQWQHYFLLRAFFLPPIRQKAIARLCSSGRLDLHLADLRRQLETRMLDLTQRLDRYLGRLLSHERPQGGAVIWAQSVYPVNMRQVFDQLLQARIVIAPGELFSLQGLHRQNLRITYAVDDHQPLEPILQRLGEALRQSQL